MTPELDSRTEDALSKMLGAFQAFNSPALEQAVASALMRNEAALAAQASIITTRNK